MDQSKSFSKRNFPPKANLPTLQSSMMASKTMLTVSKVDLDSRMIYKQQTNFKELTRHQERSYSALMKRNQSKSKLAQTTSKPSDKGKQGAQKITYIGNQSLNDLKTQLPKSLRVQKSKISSKTHGIVKAYAANSHPGPYNSINEARVCIASNLTKTNIKQNQVQFFAIYDGNNGSALADYMRDKFHHFLIEDKYFSVDIEIAIKNTIKRIQNNFDNDPIYCKNNSQVSFIIFIIIGKLGLILGSVGYCVQMGQAYLIISQNLGKEHFRLITKAQSKIKNKVNSYRKLQFMNQNQNRVYMSNLHFETQYRQGKQLNIKKIEIGENIDFIILGSNFFEQHRGQGLFETLKDIQLIQKAWKTLLQSQNEQTIHVKVGEMANKLLNQIFINLTTKNVSIIIIGFEPIAQLIKKDEKIELPFIQNNKI